MSAKALDAWNELKQASNKIKTGILKLEPIGYLYGVAILTHGGVQNTTISISSH
jgi:hypothetical protein